MEQHYTLSLSQLVELSGDSPPECYHKSYKFSVDVDGETINYVLCHPAQFKRWEHETNMGFQDAGEIYVSRRLKPQEIPFVALRLHYQGLSVDDLGKRFGENMVQGLSQAKIEDLILLATLTYAHQFLRPNDFAEFVQRHQREPFYVPARHDPIINEILTFATKERPLPALLEEHEHRAVFYLRQVADYLKAHSLNKYVRRSRGMETVASHDPLIQKWYGTDITRADTAVRALMEDTELRHNVSGLIKLVQELKQYTSGNEVVVDALASKALYIMETAFYRSQKPPFTFVEEKEETMRSVGLPYGYNRINFTKHRSREFFESLERRLSTLALNEHNEIEAALEGIDAVVTEVRSGKNTLDNRFKEGIALLTQTLASQQPETTGTALVPYSSPAIPKEAAAELRDRRDNLRDLITEAPAELAALPDLIRAYNTLRNNGLSTEEVENKIAELRGISDQPLKALGLRTSLSR